jgi:uncharacterized protein YwqG
MSLPDFLAPFRNELEPFKRDYIHIEPTAVDPDHNCDDYHIDRAVLDVHVSKFLGKPYWPQSMDYPKRSSDGRPMIPVAQINFAETPALGDFPRSGLLQLFVCAGEGDYLTWKRDGNYRIVFHDKIDANVLYDFSFLTPDLFSDSPLGAEAILTFEKSVEYGGIDDVNFTFSGSHDPDTGKFDYDLFEAFLDSFTAEQQPLIEHELLGGRGEKIGGYADFTQVDPREKDGDVLILQIDGFREAFHQGVGHVFMPLQALCDRDFSKAYLHHDNT